MLLEIIQMTNQSKDLNHIWPQAIKPPFLLILALMTFAACEALTAPMPFFFLHSFYEDTLLIVELWELQPPAAAFWTFGISHCLRVTLEDVFGQKLRALAAEDLTSQYRSTEGDIFSPIILWGGITIASSKILLATSI